MKMYFLRIMFREQMSLSRSLGTYQLEGADLLIPDCRERGGRGWEGVGEEVRGAGEAVKGKKGSCRNLSGVGFPGCG